MPLSNIKLPADDVRLITHEDTVYKLKLSYNTVNTSAFLPCSKKELNQQVEQILRTVIYAKQTGPLKIKTEHFFVDCTFYDWSALRLIGFKKDNVRLKAHPQVISIKLTPRGLPPVSHENEDVHETSNHSAKRHKSDDTTSKRETRRSGQIQETKSSQLQEERSTDKQQSKGRRREDCLSLENDGDQATYVDNRRKLRQEEVDAVETIARKKKTHRTPLQFVEPADRVLHVDSGKRVIGDNHDNDTSHTNAARISNDDRQLIGPRKSARLVEFDIRGGGEGLKTTRRSPRLHLPKARKPISSRNYVSEVSPRSRSKSKSPQPSKKRRSSLGNMIASFLDEFW